jgi:hypothetical protein
MVKPVAIGTARARMHWRRQPVRVGAEYVMLARIPGRVFKAKVDLVIDAIAAGQLQATGTLVSGETWAATGLWSDLHSSMTRPDTRCRSVRPAKPRSTPIIFTSCHCCGRFCCACAAGGTMCLSNRSRRPHDCSLVGQIKLASTSNFSHPIPDRPIARFVTARRPALADGG